MKGNINNESCLLMGKGGNWNEILCLQTFPYICQYQYKRIQNNTTLDLEYNNDQLVFPAFKVRYTYTFQSQDLLDSWENTTMTGFRLSWFLQNSLPMKESDAGAPNYYEPNLVRMVQLAKLARDHNLTRDDVIRKSIEEKGNLILQGALTYSKMCSKGQFRIYEYQHVFTTFDLGLNYTTQVENVVEEDIKTGILIYSIFTYCSESVALSEFLHNLLTTQSPRTIIQAIQLESIKGSLARKMFNQFYLALYQTFDLKLGKIFLATASRSQLKAMMDMGWPYLTPYSKEIDICLNGTSCQGLNNLVQTIGMNIIFVDKNV